MPRTARLWKGAGPLTLGGLLLCGTIAAGAEPAAPPPLSQQLVSLARQAAASGRPADAASFYRQALKLDPKNAEARAGLAKAAVRRVRRQDAAMPAEDAAKPAVPDAVNPAVEPEPAPPPEEQKKEDGAPARPADAADTPNAPADAPTPATPPDAPNPPADATEVPPPPQPGATLEALGRTQQVAVQQLTAAIRDQIARARQLVDTGNIDAALDTLRLAQNALQSGTDVPEDIRARLARDLVVEMRETQRREDILIQNRAEALRLQAASEQKARTLEQLNTNLVNINALMTQFNTLMEEGQYNVLFNGGTGDLQAAVAPFYQARILAQHARALDPNALAPRAGTIVSEAVGFLDQAYGFQTLKRFRYLLTLNDVERASVPFPDNQYIEYPPADLFRIISEKRTKRYESTDLVNRDPKTIAILDKLNQPISIPFESETPLEDVIKYIKQATGDDKMPQGIPIYVDPVGLQEHERTMASTVTLNLEGVALKTALKLLLKQLDLIYTVKDGLLTITSKDAQDTPTEIRVYPVADLAIIPRALVMGGGQQGGGGMGGGGMGGGGMGGGGMGGGMGGGGMGGGGMGGMGGMMSLPPDDPSPAGGLEEKKSN